MEPILSVQHLTTKLLIKGKAYAVVDDLSFDILQGKTLALVGESGCGKSMTALSILRILPMPPALSSTGKVLYKGVDLLSLSENAMRKYRGKHLSMIFQDPMAALNPVYTIGSQLLEVAHLHLGLKGEAAEECVLRVLEDVHLPNPRQQMQEYPHQMSGGMLQRAMIAMALICEPDLLIADEPTTALDVTIQAQILDLLKELQEQKGMALLLITHDMGVVAEMADDVIVMYATQQIEQAPVEEIFDNPAHPYTQGLFQSRPNHPLQEGRLPVIEGNVPPLNALPSGCRFHPRCPSAMEICKEKSAPHFTMPGAAHMTKCWLFDEHLVGKLHDDDSA